MVLDRRDAVLISMRNRCLKSEWSATSGPASSAPTLPSCKYTTVEKYITNLTVSPHKCIEHDRRVYVCVQVEDSERSSAVRQTFSPLGEGAHQLPEHQICPGRDVQPLIMATPYPLSAPPMKKIVPVNV